MFLAGLMRIICNQSTQRMTIRIAVYTEIILLMMSIKPARNM
jgi:hypothetical protein